MRAIIAAVTLCTIAASAEARDTLKIGKGTFVFDSPQFQLMGKTVILDAEFAENPGADRINSLLPWDIQAKKFFVVRTSKGLKNGFAIIHDGNRYIVYDPNIGSTDRLWDAREALIIAHEVGHHVCGHTAGQMQSNPWQKELEADRFAGAAVRFATTGYPEKGMEPAFSPYSITDVLEVAKQLFSAEGSDTHPPREQRIAAILDGFNNGFPCGGDWRR
jgi:hypothetical protein